MRYSSDLRKRVLDFIQNGGSKAEAARRFQVSRTCIYQWLAAPNPLTYQKPGPRKPHRLDPDELATHVKAVPDATQKERAAPFWRLPTMCLVWTEENRMQSKKKRLPIKCLNAKCTTSFLPNKSYHLKHCSECDASYWWCDGTHTCNKSDSGSGSGSQ